MRLTFYTKESIVLFFNKTNLSNTIFSYHSKLVITFFLLVFSINISFGNIQTNNWQASSYFSKQIQNYSKALLKDVIVELENSQQERKTIHNWVALHQEFSSSSSTINSGIAVGSDDTEEDIALDGINEGLVDIANADLELGVESEAQLVGLRFTNIAIPKRARIVSAYVEFEGDETGSETTNLTIYGEATDNANTFSTATKDISNRVKTITSVTCNNLPTWAVGGKYESTDIAPIIQEIVDRNGWISGNDLAIKIEGTGKRTTESYNGAATAAALLVITYDESLTSCTNLLTNEEFDNGTDDWRLDVDGSTAASASWNIDNSNQLSGTNSVFVNITNATSLAWNIQLLQENKSIVVGREYQVVFEAKATAERDMVAAVQRNTGTVTTYGSQEVSLTTEPQTYSFKFIAPETNTGGVALIFHLAKSTDNVFIDNVRFSEACITEICDNNIDDDGDGLVDNEDADCSSSITCISCAGPNLFDNPSFENGTWTGSETFVTGVLATNLTNEFPRPLDYWGYAYAKWVESDKATDGNRFVYLNSDVYSPVCFSQAYTFGDGKEINDCDTYQVCLDWASFNSDFPNGRTTTSQPSIDFIFRDNAKQSIKFISVPLGTATANQSWNNLTWENLSFAFKFEGNLTAPANTANIDILISERNGQDNGILLDNTSLCMVNSCSNSNSNLSSSSCSVTNMYPGFALDQVGNNCSWLDYTLDNDLNFTNNGDGTATIAGKIVDGFDADWDGGTCTGSPCGADDAWYLTLNLSNKQSWAELQAAGGTANVHTNCSTNNLDYWEVSGTLTGLGCNSGRTLTINSAASNYRLQIGYGGNSNDSNCAFGLSTWFEIEESGSPMQADIYAFLDASCYEEPEEICNNNIDDDGDGLTDCEDPDCKSIAITDLSFSECVLTGSEYQATISIEVSWSNPPAGEGINVTTPNNTEFIDIVGGATSPHIVQFVIAADNSTNPLTIAYTGGNGCGVDSYYDAPAPCPDGTERNRPCTNGSGHVGGVVFEDLSGDGLQDVGEPGIEGIMVTATDSIGATVGQTLTNNIGIFEFADLTDGDKFKLEFTAIPSGMYPTNGSTFKGTTVQYVDAPSCSTTLGLLNPITNACKATNSTILQNGYSVVACLPAGDDVTLAIKDITQLGTLWQTPANRNTNQYSNVPTIRMWETSDFEGEEIFSMAIDPRDGTIYAVASPLYGDGANISSVLFEENIAPKVFKINPETGIVTRIAQLPGTLGLGAIDFDVINEQLLITNMDDGKIYRLNTDGVVLNSYDPLAVDNGISSQLPNLGDRILGIAFNPIEKRLYYAVWSNHTTFNSTYENINNNYNTIRSVALDLNGDFIASTDQLEITVPYNPVPPTMSLTTPTADMAFNRAGDRLLLSELSIIENNSTGQLSTSAHAGSVKEYQKVAGGWMSEPTYASNSQGKYDIGNIVDYKGRNSRGGIDWAYERVSGNTIFGDDDFILATGDALHVASRDGDYIYGYQFTPSTGGNIANSILVDLDNDLINADKYVYSDVDIYKNYCADLSLEVGNYVWLDSDEDGVQDLYEVGLAGVNVTLFNAAGDSLTSVVTDADGAYYFNENISGFGGLTPNTTYYIVVGRGGQFNTTSGALSFVFDLTVPNTGDGNYTDENDSDGVIGNPSYGHPITITGYPTIELTTGANGQNDYSFDFGFKELCAAAVAVNDSIPTCSGVEYEGSVSLNDSNYEDKTYSVISNPSRGRVTMGANGTFVYTGNSSTCISDEFVYQVCDASNICCAYATVYLDFADVSKPTLQNIPDNDTISCDEVVPLPPQIFALDNCPGISLDVEEVDTQGEDGCSLYDYTITRTWTAIDQCGNFTSASQIIEVQDLIAPDIYRIYTLPNGKRMVAGVMELVSGNWKTVSLPIDFDTKPIILHQVTTNDGLTPVVAQIQNVSVSQFELRIAAEEANTNKLARESVSWIAMEAGIQSTDYQFEMNSLLLSNTSEVVTFQNSFAATPALFTSAQTTNEEDPASIRNDILTTSGVVLMVQEETSDDTESTHLDEQVGYLALEKIGDLRDEKGILLGEVGTTTINNTWKTITLNNTYANPVIIANSLSINGADPSIVRVQNVGLNSFQVKVEEWAYLDGSHANETVSYMVVEGSIPLESPTYCHDGTDSLDIGVDFKAVDNCDVSVIINYTEKDTFIDAAKVITRTWSAEDECGNSTSYSQEIICQGVSLQLKSILQGAMLNNTGNGLMRDDLRKKGILPLEEPYTQMPFFEHVSSGGGEVMDANLLTIDGADGIVDWVFVELRDANDIKNVVATQSALIQCDGDIVTAKGDSIILFSNTRVGDYFVSVRHRNHLGMITLNTETFTPTNIPFVDFTFAFTPVVGNHPSIKIDNLESLWSGDLNSDGKVIYQGPNNDIFYMFLHVLQDEGNVDFLPNFISNRYTNDDFNLDGSVIYQGPDNDRAKLLFNTILRHPDNPQKFSNFIIYRGEGGN